MRKLIIMFVIPFLATSVYAANVTINDLTADTNPTTSAFMEIETGGAARKSTIGQILVDENIPDTITINQATTAGSLTVNPANCSSGNSPLGIDQSGVAEGCFDVWTEAENTAAAYLADVTGSALLDARIWIGDAGNLAQEIAPSGDISMDNAGVVTVANDSHTHITTNITGTNAGTNLSADLEEETHASEHEDTGTDEVAVTAGMMNAGTGASSSTFWRGDNTWATPSGAGDNLGNHTATTTLDMNGNSISNALHVTATGTINAAEYKLNAGFMDITEISEPVSPSSDTARIYAIDDNAKTRFQYKLSDETTVQIARDNIFVVKNDQGSELNKGNIVYISGGVGASGTAEVKLAKADSTTTTPACCIVMETIGIGDFGRAMTSGKFVDFDTSDFSESDIVWLSATTAGSMTAIKPPHPNLQQRLGVILNSNINNGDMVFFPVGIKGDNDGTNQNEWRVGDGSVGTRAISYINTVTGTLQWNPTSGQILDLPDETGTICSTGSVCTGYQPSGTYVTAVSGTTPIASSGGTTPAISIADGAADGTTKGAVTFFASDFNSVTGSISIDYTNGQAASDSTKGFLTSTDWTTFNSKLSAEINNLETVTTGIATTEIPIGTAPNTVVYASLSGDATMDNTGVVTVINDSHTHVYTNITGTAAGTNLGVDLEEENHAGEHHSGGGDAIDHGSIDGLSDDDHTQYLLKAGGTTTGTVVSDNAFGIQFEEASGNGNNYVSIRAVDSLGGNVILILGDDLRTCAAGEVLEVANAADGVVTLECDTDDGGGSDTNSIKEYWWPASALLPLEAGESIPPINKDAGTNIDQLTVDFNDSTDECRTVSFKVPSDVTSGSTVTFRTHWYSAATTSGNAIWDFRHNGGVAEGTDPDQALSTVAAAADAVQGTAGQITVTTWTETLANLGWAANEQVDGQFCRDANNGSDTLSNDAKITGFGVEMPRS
jgi:hypothetical protein